MSHSSVFVLSFRLCLVFNQILNQLRIQKVTWPPIDSYGIQHISRFKMDTSCLNHSQPYSDHQARIKRGSLRKPRESKIKAVAPPTSCHLFLPSALRVSSQLQLWVFPYSWSHTYPSCLITVQLPQFGQSHSSLSCSLASPPDFCSLWVMVLP